MKYSMWLLLTVDDTAQWARPVIEAAAEVIQEMDGEVVKAEAFGDVIIRASFPHRKVKSLERTLASALRSTPVTGTTVQTSNPFAIRKPRGAY